MAKQSKEVRLIQQLQDWGDDELEELVEMIAGLRSDPTLSK
jgi:hypothetical protein